MSAEEDADLRDLIAQTLENNGVLGKIKAELRAKVFMVLEAHDRNETNKLPFVNENLRNFMNTKEGRVVTSLVREFMEFFGLEFSLAVFDPETNFGDRYRGRDGLAEEFGVDNVSNSSKPVLASLLEYSHLGMPKLDLTSLNEDKLKKGRISPEISPRSLSSGSMNNSPRFSRIPQPVKDIKRGEKSDTKYPKELSPELSPKDDEPKSLYKGNIDLSLSLNDDEILAEFTQPRRGPTQEKMDNKTKKDHFLGEDRPLQIESLRSGNTNLASLKTGSLLSGSKDLGISSPDLKDLAEIDRRIDELGFGLPGEDKIPNVGDDYNDSYGEDFHTSTHSSSIQEEIDGDPLSIDSYRSEGSKADDLITSDRTVSPVDFKDFDYGEMVENF